MGKYIWRILALASLAGCAGDDSMGQGENGTGSDTTAGCPLGDESCPCNLGRCLEGLTCLSEVCVEVPPADPTTGETGAEDGTGGETGPAGCLVNDECTTSQVCNGGTCSDAWDLHLYDVRVTSFNGCVADGWGGAEMFYRVLADGEFAFRSADSSCPASWPDEAAEIIGFEIFEVQFWENDEFSDDFVTKLCWADPFDETICGPVPKIILHWGTYTQCWPQPEDVYCADFEFTLVE